MIRSMEWADALKPGDVVIVSPGFGRDNDRLEKVDKVTPTQIVLACGSRYRRKDGDLVGNNDRWSRWSIEEPTKEAVERIRKRQAADWISRHQGLEKVPLETLLWFVEQVKEATTPAPEASDE